MGHRANLQAVLLAAGKSTRFKTEQSKLVFPICGQEMILYPISLFQKMGIPTTIIVGYQKELIQECVSSKYPEVTYAEQTVQRGTGDAVLCSKPYWNAEHILIMNGDCPLVAEHVIEDLISKHLLNNAAISFVTSHNSDPTLQGYGRVIKEAGIIKVIEQKDFRGDPSLECCINAGIYLIKRQFLEKNLEHIQPNALTGEIYLPELIRMAAAQKLHVETIHVPFDYVRGVNTLKELWTAEHIKRSELVGHWMSQGVRFSAPQSVHLDLDVTIGSGSVIGSGAILLKGTRIGTHSFIDAFSVISNSIIHDNVTIFSHSVIHDSVIHSEAQVGPFAHIRNKSTVGISATIGNFVEMSASTMGHNSKAKHLSYLGTAQIGSNVNIGAGTITANFNGYTKNTTVIKDNASIGSNCSLVAPVTVGQEAMTAAGSTITNDVPDNALAIARSRQENKPDYADKIRAKCQSASECIIINNEKPQYDQL